MQLLIATEVILKKIINNSKVNSNKTNDNNKDIEVEEEENKINIKEIIIIIVKQIKIIASIKKLVDEFILIFIYYVFLFRKKKIQALKKKNKVLNILKFIDYLNNKIINNGTYKKLFNNH